MAKQKHDPGVLKRKHGRKPLSRARLQFERAKRRHPGPLPYLLRNFVAWLDAGRPRVSNRPEGAEDPYGQRP